MEYVSWRGTPGVGDFMWALNCVHNYCYTQNKQVTLEFHWEHDEHHLHHFEDPETIIERLEYMHNFYHRKDDVQVKHVYAEKLDTVIGSLQMTLEGNPMVPFVLQQSIVDTRIDFTFLPMRSVTKQVDPHHFLTGHSVR